jgi:hypothetical protein
MRRKHIFIYLNLSSNNYLNFYSFVQNSLINHKHINEYENEYNSYFKKTKQFENKLNELKIELQKKYNYNEIKEDIKINENINNEINKKYDYEYSNNSNDRDRKEKEIINLNNEKNNPKNDDLEEEEINQEKKKKKPYIKNILKNSKKIINHTIKDTYLEKYTKKAINAIKNLGENNEDEEEDEIIIPKQYTNDNNYEEDEIELDKQIKDTKFCEICYSKCDLNNNECYESLKHIKIQSIELIAHISENEIWIMLKNNGEDTEISLKFPILQNLKITKYLPESFLLQSSEKYKRYFTLVKEIDDIPYKFDVKIGIV